MWRRGGPAAPMASSAASAWLTSMSRSCRSTITRPTEGRGWHVQPRAPGRRLALLSHRPPRSAPVDGPLVTYPLW